MVQKLSPVYILLDEVTIADLVDGIIDGDEIVVERADQIIIDIVGAENDNGFSYKLLSTVDGTNWSNLIEETAIVGSDTDSRQHIFNIPTMHAIKPVITGIGADVTVSCTARIGVEV